MAIAISYGPIVDLAGELTALKHLFARHVAGEKIDTTEFGTRLSLAADVARLKDLQLTAAYGLLKQEGRLN